MTFWQQRREGPVLVGAYVQEPLNYYTEEAFDDLEGLIDAARDRQVRALVLCGGRPGTFITHFSAEHILAGLRDPARLVEQGPTRNHRVTSITRALGDLPVPVLAAMNGDTMGFGLELSLACDFRIGEAGDYRYGFPEVRMGIIPGGGGTQRLARLVGPGVALDLVLRSRLLRPHEAYEAGIVHEVARDAVARAIELGQELAGLAPLAVAMAKHAILDGSDLAMPSALALETDASFRAKLHPAAVTALEEYVAVPMERRRDWLERI